MMQRRPTQVAIGQGPAQDAIGASHQQDAASRLVQGCPRVLQGAVVGHTQGFEFAGVHRNLRAGTPAYTPGWVRWEEITAPAPTTTSSPTRTPGSTTAPLPTSTRLPICTA